jgi:predicted acyl esterase
MRACALLLALSLMGHRGVAVPDQQRTTRPTSSEDTLRTAAAAAPPRYKTTALTAHRVAGAGGVVLEAYTIAPTGTQTVGKHFPLVVFVNSWATSGEEYGNIAAHWAQQGYVVVEYVARGWYLSTGKVDVAGPDNSQDASAVLDWALKEFAPIVAPTKIALGGVSYGAVVAQVTAARDKRVRVVVSSRPPGASAPSRC